MVTIEGRWRPSDRVASRYQYVPVSVSGVVTVSLEYDRGAGVLDLGCLSAAGEFQGWSGG